MTFLAQVDLADLPQFGAREALPPSGVLWFFASLDDVMAGEEGVRVLFDQRSRADWPERPAPQGLAAMAEGYTGYDWLPSDDPWRTTDVRAGLTFHPLRSWFDWSLRSARQPDEAELSDALGRAPRVAPDAYAFQRALLLESEDWPWAGAYAEFAAAIAASELPPTDPLDNRPAWTQAGLALRTALAEEAAEIAAHWRARRDRPLSRRERAEFRGWLTAFGVRSASLSREETGGWGMPDARQIDDAVRRTALFASYQLLQSGHSQLVPLDVHADVDGVGAVPVHQMLGYASSPQDMGEYGLQVLLLQIDSTADLFWFEDVGCVFHFWISVPDLLSRRFDRVTSSLECD